MSNTERNPFLEGNFAPIREENQSENLEVVGELPAEINGCFVRNGPNSQFDPIGKYHWFDGDGMLHATEIENGRASYRNRWIRTEGFEKEREAGKALWTGFAELGDPKSPDGNPFKNLANTALVYHGNRALALWEAGAPYQFSLPSLDTVGLHDFEGRLTHPFTAHPRVDARTGEMMTFGYSPFPPYVRYSVVNPAGELVHTTEIDLDVPVMIHDMVITEHYSVIFDFPFTFRLDRIAKGEAPFKFEFDRPARFGFLPRHGDGKQIRWIETPPCYMFHATNAYEEDDDIVIVGSRLAYTTALAGGERPKELAPGEDGQGRMHRWRFNLNSGVVKEEPLDDTPSDFARVADALVGRKNRYSYNALFEPGQDGGVGDVPLFAGLARYDLDRGTKETHLHGPGRFGGEGVYVARPGSQDDGDGWVMTYVHDEREGTDELVVIDVQDFEAPPLARIQIPTRIPYGFHAGWFPAEQLRSQQYSSASG